MTKPTAHSAMAPSGSVIFVSCLTLAALSACVPRQDGVTRLPFNEDVPLAFGDQRLLVPLDRRQAYQVHLTPTPGDWAVLTASLCTLDVHQRVDEGDSHCLGQEVMVDGAGVNTVAISAATEPNDRKFGHLAMDVRAEGTTPGPVVLRIDAQ
jgi:hypothetical protein